MAKTYLGVGKSLQNTRLLDVATPTAGTDGANKNYVDASILGFSWKSAARVASTANVSITSAPSAIDGVTLASLDRVVLKNQTAGAENGIWQFNGTAVALTRTTDGDTAAELNSAAVTVSEGTTNSDTMWVQTANLPITVGTTALAFAQIGGASGGFSVAGAGLVATGSTVDAVAGAGITITADAIAVDATVERKVNFNVGDGTATSITLSHNLNTRDVHVTMYRNSTPWDELDIDANHDTVNTVILIFATAPAASAFRAHVTA